MRSFILLTVFTTAECCTVDSDCPYKSQLCDDGTCRRRHKCDSVTCSAPNTECERKTGSCICAEGFALNSNGDCKLDVCVSNTCNRWARCSLKEKADGNFEEDCKCREGKRGDGWNYCTKDWCGLNLHRCGDHAICHPLGADYGYDYDCKCKTGYVGTGSRHEAFDGGSGYKSNCEHFPCDEKLITPSDAKYDVVFPEEDSPGFSWTAAQQLCREKGSYWDLVVIDDMAEHRRMMELTNCHTNAFWVGIHKVFTGADFKTILNDKADFLNKWKVGQPTNLEKELCVRMRLGQFNDASCRTPFTDKKSSGIGMGYICEKHSRRVQEGLKCEQKNNDRVSPFKTGFGCPKPTCLGKGNYKIVDSWWRPSNGAGLAKLYGFAISVTLDQAALSNGGSIMLRFANGNQMGNIQTYNLKFFGFYNNNNDVLFHTKWWNTDRHDKKTVMIVVDNISSPDYPEAYYWNGRINQHQCFQNGISRNARPPVIMDQAVKALKPDLEDAERVRAVSFRDGKLKRIKT